MTTTEFETYLSALAEEDVVVIDPTIPRSAYCELDLSVSNEALHKITYSSSKALEDYVLTVIHSKDCQVAYGGYLERRKIYQRSEHFSSAESEDLERSIHLGIDIWSFAGTSVHACSDGIIHSFRINDAFGDYGPTIIMQHEFNDQFWYSLYGHLSFESLEKIKPGQLVKKGEQIGTLGTSDVNGDYPPHLHFQIIKDLEGKIGDYPGVCCSNDLPFYRSNCPDPNLLLKLGKN